MKIVLVGYMGSGKSTIGKLLAKRLNVNFLDLDSYIETAEGNTVKQLFSEKGELYFRKKEFFYLNEILDSQNHIVLATGGGTPCYGNNMAAITKATKNSIYLKVSLPELVKRLFVEKSQRPLIANIADEDLIEFIGKHLFERSFYYNQAEVTLSCDGRLPQDLALEIEKGLV